MQMIFLDAGRIILTALERILLKKDVMMIDSSWVVAPWRRGRKERSAAQARVTPKAVR